MVIMSYIKRIDNLNLENIILLDEVSNPLDYLDAMDIFYYQVYGEKDFQTSWEKQYQLELCQCKQCWRCIFDNWQEWIPI